MKKGESPKIIHGSSLPDTNPRMRSLEEMLKEPDSLDEDAVQTGLERVGEYAKMDYRAKLFAIHYCKDFNGTRAAISSGYSEKSAHTVANKLLSEPGIQLAILKRQQALASVATLSREWVMTELSEIIEECRAAEKPDRHLQLKALDMIAKLSGYYASDIQLNVQNNIESIKIEIIKGHEQSAD